MNASTNKIKYLPKTNKRKYRKLNVLIMTTGIPYTNDKGPGTAGSSNSSEDVCLCIIALSKLYWSELY